MGDSFFLLLPIVFINCNKSFILQNLFVQLEVESIGDGTSELDAFKSIFNAICQFIKNREQGVLRLLAVNRSWYNLNSTVHSFVVDKWIFGFSLGEGWLTLENAFNSFFKHYLIKLQKKASPFLSVSLYQNTSNSDEGIIGSFGLLGRINRTSQILLRRKFSPDFSLQISSIHIYSNRYALTLGHLENHFSLGFDARYRIVNYVSLVYEYYCQSNPVKTKKTYRAFAKGLNWELKYFSLRFHYNKCSEYD